MTNKALFEPYSLGSLTLSNRIVMAPLTRNRAGPGFVPSDLAAEYYGQRASAGLIISEATQISQQGQGYQDTPGIYTQAQIEGWRKVTDAVHAKGGHIFLQLWHVGRVSHVDLQPNGQAPVAPSAVRDGTNTRIDAFGGSIENRARLTLEVTAAVVGEIGANRTGVRISPVSPANGVSATDPQAQFNYIVEKLDELGIAYLHVVEGATGG